MVKICIRPTAAHLKLCKGFWFVSNFGHANIAQYRDCKNGPLDLSEGICYPNVIPIKAILDPEGGGMEKNRNVAGGVREKYYWSYFAQ